MSDYVSALPPARRRIGTFRNHIKRITAKLIVMNQHQEGEEAPEATSYPVTFILNDFRPEGVELFCPERIPPGTPIHLKVNAPEPIEIKGHVLWAKEILKRGKILADYTYRFRLGMTFQESGADDQIKAYCLSIFKKFIRDSSKAAA